MIDDLNRLSASAAAAGLRAGEFSAEQLTRACLARIEAREPDVQAWAFLDPELALTRARELDAAYRDRGPVGPLHGLPVGIKDIIDTADMPTEHGSPIFQGHRPEQDAACVTALRRAGAVILGKTVTTELANTCPNKTRNPHNLNHTPGGSSSGSAAAVADFHLPLALGTQTGGSVIRPASFCGIYGFKPTLGLVPRDGVLMQSHTLDTVGGYGRSLDDLALLIDAMSEAMAGLCAALRHPPAQNGAPRLALVKTPVWEQADSGARRAILGLAAELGERCFEAEPAAPFGHIVELHQTVMNAEDLSYYGRFLQRSPELLSEQLRQRLLAAQDIAAADYILALNDREVIYAELERLLDRADAVLCLASAGPAPRGLDSTGSPMFNGLWTYLGVPCVTLPLLSVDGLPLGVQLVGRRNGDAALLAVARRLEAALGSGRAERSH